MLVKNVLSELGEVDDTALAQAIDQYLTNHSEVRLVNLCLGHLQRRSSRFLACLPACRVENSMIVSTVLCDYLATENKPTGYGALTWLAQRYGAQLPGQPLVIT